MSVEDGIRVLHWLPNECVWEKISLETWQRFLGLKSPPVGLSSAKGGIHFFVVCVDENNVPLNLVPHKYLVDANGQIGSDNFAGLNREERNDYRQLMLSSEPREESPVRLQEIREKMWSVYFPPRESILALFRALPNVPPSGSAAARFLAELVS